jgi:hypothetical protein
MSVSHFDPSITFFVYSGVIAQRVVGGEILGIDMTSLLVAGTFANASWIFPLAGVTVAGIVGLALRKRFR